MKAAALISILNDATEVTDIVGTNIFPGIGASGQKETFVAYGIEEEDYLGLSGGACVRTSIVRLHICSKKRTELDDLQDALELNLHRYRGTVEGVNIDLATFQGVSDDTHEKDADLYHKILIFKFLTS